MDPKAEEFTARSKEFSRSGNRFAALEEYETALRCFTYAISINPNDFKSFCYEKVQQYENALQDADVVLHLQPKWITGLFRKGKALFGLKRYYEATLIYDELLLQRFSGEAIQELAQAQMFYLMELGCTQEQSLEALKKYGFLDDAAASLLHGRKTEAIASLNNVDKRATWEVPHPGGGVSPGGLTN